MKYRQLLIITFLSSVTFGQNLIINPSAELDPTTNGWTQLSGNWVSGTERPAQDGAFHFFAGSNSGSVELFQDVSVTAFSTTIDAGTQFFYFAGYIRAYNNGNDAGRIIVEYRDITSTVLATYDTGEYSTAAWLLYSDTRLAPVGTRTIRIRLISRRLTGSDNDGYMDDLQLVQGTSPLPIELIKFTASVKMDNTVQVNWITASEINNDYFTIEKSQDGITWKPFTTISGAGNSSVQINYDVLDQKPYNGISYYRLKQTDFDGQFSYSEIKSVTLKSINSNITIYPNPTINQITIEGDKKELEYISIYNSLGQDVTYLTILVEKSETKVIINLTNLSKGIYYIKTNENNYTINKR